MTRAAQPTSLKTAGASGTANGSNEEEDQRAVHSKARLDQRLAEIERRMEAAKAAADPKTWFASPWTPFAAGCGFGFLVGLTDSASPIIRALLTSAAAPLLQKALLSPPRP